MITFWVPGHPAPKGSRVPLINATTGKAMTLESSKLAKPWQTTVAWYGLSKVKANQRLHGPVAAGVRFYLLRPASHYGTGRNAGVLKDSAEPYPVGHQRGDLDKLLRTTWDGLTTGKVWDDDAYVVELLDGTGKQWCDRERPVEGAQIVLMPMVEFGRMKRDVEWRSR